VDLVAEAKLPIGFDTFQGALDEFLQVVHDRCVPNGQSCIHLSLHENGCKANRLLAEALPPGVRAFGIGPGLDLRKTLSAAEFLAQVRLSPPARSYCHATLTDSLSFEQGLALVKKTTAVLPPSGRSTTIMLRPERVKLRGVPEAVRADLMFARWQAGPQRKAASLRVSCPAEGKSDASARQALRTVGELLGLRFGKPWKQHPSGSDKEKPDANAVWVAHKSFQAAFDRTTKEVEDEGIMLAPVPMLFPRFQAFGKRIADVQQGKREKIDLVPHLKRLVRESQPGYVFDQSDAEWVMFRKHLTPLLDGLLSFERFHHHGLGKSFTLQFGVDFPGNRELQQNPLLSLFRESFFTVFHRNWEEPAWTYATAEELQKVLQGCAALLSRVLPLLERRLVEMLSPQPTELPMTIP